jgi:hypothetical protein
MRTAFPTQSAFPRQVLPRGSLSRFLWFGGSPPPISRFGHRRSGFRHSFTPPALSREGARPTLVIRRLFASGREGPRAACRLLQSIRSASTTRIDEPRMTSPTVARGCSHSRDHGLSIVDLSCERRRALRRAASRDVTGQGLHQGQLASVRHLPPRSLAVVSFAPTRSARTPHVAARDVRKPEKPASLDALSVRHARASLTSTAGAIAVSLGSRFRGPAGTGPPPAFPREGERDPPHPRCLPSLVGPCRGPPRPSPSCPQPVD